MRAGDLQPLSAGNMHVNTVTSASAAGYRAAPLLDFFMERYAAAYRAELAYFVKAIETGAEISPNGQDGLKALELADAAVQSMAAGKAIKVSI